jgi:integrase
MKWRSNVNEGEHFKGKYGGVFFRQGKRGIFQISYQGTDGKEHRESTHTTNEAQASRILEARRRGVIKAQENGEEFESPRLRKMTIAQCLDAWEIQCKLKGRSSDTYRFDKKQLIQRFGGMRCDQLTKSVYQQYQLEQKMGLVDDKKSRGRNSKLNRHLVVLSSAMKVAGVTPAYQKGKKDLVLPEPEPRTGYFSPAEFQILHALLPSATADVCLFLWLSGWRLSECCGKMISGVFRPGLLWSETTNDTITLPGERNKGRKRKTIPVSGELKALIERRRALKVEGSDLVFHGGNGQPVNISDRVWKKACVAAGKPNGTIHDLRRSRARIWIRSGISENLAMKMGGWKTRSIFDRYDIISDDDMRLAQEKTERYLEKELEKQVEGKQISTAIN